MSSPANPLGYQNPTSTSAILESETSVAGAQGSPDTVREVVSTPGVENVLKEILNELKEIRQFMEDHS